MSLNKRTTWRGLFLITFWIMKTVLQRLKPPRTSLVPINRESMISGKSQQPAHPAAVWQQIQKYPLTPELVLWFNIKSPIFIKLLKGTASNILLGDPGCIMKLKLISNLEYSSSNETWMWKIFKKVDGKTLFKYSQKYNKQNCLSGSGKTKIKTGLT